MKDLLKSAAIGLLLITNAALVTAHAQTTAFTYQGKLNDTGAPANGSYDISFAAYDAAVGGDLIGAMVTNVAVSVSNGVFATSVDLGAGVFTGDDRWLEIAVSTNGANAFSTMVPRQMFSPAPYAIYSPTAGTADTAAVANAVASATISATGLNTAGAPASGQVLAFNGTQLVWQDPAVGGASGGWSLSGNWGTSPDVNYLGTLDNQPLELRVGGTRALRLEPDASGSANFIAGAYINSAGSGVVGATVGGGGAANYGGLAYTNTAGSDFTTVAGGARNNAAAWGATVGGGYYNTALNASTTIAGGDENYTPGLAATIGGGAENTASRSFATVAGGNYNVASGSGAFVGGGGVGDGSDQSTIGNTASGDASVVTGGNGNLAAGNSSIVGGGQLNIASGVLSVVPGGDLNTAAGDYSFAAGFGAEAATTGSFVWADPSAQTFASTAVNQFLIRATGGVGIGTAQTPPNGLRVGSGGLAVTGASSPNYPGAAGVFIEKFSTTAGAIYAYDYVAGKTLPLCFNTPGGNVGIGTINPQNTLDVNGTTRTHSLIITGGSDLAEPFKMGAETIAEGSVVVIDEEHPGELKRSASAYDPHVAGIVSGANGIRPGIALQQEGRLEGGQNVALTGRVYVLADARHEAIKPGDMLTTSDVPGHAMKATDHARAQGAIIGKAMTALAEGQGMVLVLVSLQ
jgi:hypothetical protein